MLRLENVTKTFGGKQVIASVSLHVREGEILCLTGPSGSGKSTLLEIMAGLIRPDSGKVARQCPPAVLLQEPRLIPWLTARDNIAYILPSSMSQPEQESCISVWLKTFGLGADDFPQAMSGGMRRRLALARAFASGRKLMLLDEPLAFLDSGWSTLIRSLFVGYSNKGGTLFVTDHTQSKIKNAHFIHVESTPLTISFQDKS